MDRIIRGIEVQEQFPGRPFERCGELLDQEFVDPPGRIPISAILPAAQRRTAAQILGAVQCCLDHQVMAQCIMVVEVFVTQCQPVDALLQQTQGEWAQLVHHH